MTLSELFKLLIKYLKPHKKMVWWCVFLAAFSSAISAIIPLVYGKLVDEAVRTTPNLFFIGGIILAWLVFVLLANWMTRFISYQGDRLGLLVYQYFFNEMYAHLLQLPLSFHKSKKSGEQVEKLQRAADNLWDMVSDVVFSLLPIFLTTLIALGLMFFSEWRLTLFLCLILTLYTVMTILKTKPIVKAQKVIRKAWEKTTGNVYDTTSNIEVVKHNVRENLEKELANKNFCTLIEKMTWFFGHWRTLSAWQNNIQGLGFVMIFGLALFFLLRGEITAGVLVTFIGYVNLVFRPFNQLASNYRRVQQGMVTVGRALKLFDLESELYQTGKSLPQVQGKIEFKNITFAYDDNKDKKILINISFTAAPGETVALVGESGTGKTTLLSLISRYYKAQKGKICLDNVDIQELNLEFLRNQIAIVPQEVSLFNDTLKKNLSYAKSKVSLTKIESALKMANAWSFVESFPKKLNQLVGERGVKLSTGQKQRIAIARAIIRNPKILILDEATSALDSVSESLVQAALKNLISGRTTFIIAHRLSTIVKADKILVFDKGRLVEQGQHADLLALQGVYFNLYQKQKF